MTHDEQSSQDAIVARGLAKRFGEVTAVAGVDLRVPRGAIYALLGPNGAGKTTTINILTTLARPDAGSAAVAGFDVVRQANEVRRRIGVTFQDIVLDPDLSGRQVLDIHARLYRIGREDRKRRIGELVALVGLEGAIDRLVKTYSGGMKRRLELARGLMSAPEVLFLDEPTQGLDPQNRVGIWEYIRELRERQGLSLLLTTHYMDEAEALASLVGIIDGGRMVAEGTPQSLVAELGADVIRIVGRGDTTHLVERLRGLSFVDKVAHRPDAGMIQVGVDNGSRRLAEVVNLASGNGYSIEDISVARPSLGDVFLKYTGRALRDE
jgi:ABC-2 type transport system ATP-binding protein